MTRRRAGLLAKGMAVAAAGAIAVYGAMVARAWLRYARPSPPAAAGGDALLDLFMPAYDVVERHEIAVRAPAEATFDALLAMDLEDSRVIRGIFRAREIVLRSRPAAPVPRGGLVSMTKRLGWVELATVPGHEIVMGAVTKPWEPDVVFRGIAPDRFAEFAEPGYVKIVWTLRADAAGEGASIARTETRAVATDDEARRRFRWYWARFSPGIALIRRLSLPVAARRAEAFSAAAAAPP